MSKYARSFFHYYSKLKEIYNELSISDKIMETLSLKASNIHLDRKLSLIHGDRHKKNIILCDDQITFIDWELGCIGDLAYDIAFHLHQMAYSESDEKYFINAIACNYKGNVQGLLDDIILYRLLILARSTLYHVYWTDLMYESNDILKIRSQLGHFMRRYNKLSQYKEFNLQPKKEEVVEKIFSQYHKKK